MRRHRWCRPCEFSPAVVVILACIVVLQFLLLIKDQDGLFQTDYSEMSKKSTQMKTETRIATSGVLPTTETIDTFRTCTCGMHYQVNGTEALVFPSTPKKKVLLAIGIPTIHRVGETYLLQTLDSLISNMADNERDDVIIIVFLADRETEKRTMLATSIKNKFGDLLQSGMISVIQAPNSYYNAINVTKLTYNQPIKYVKWRAKQNFDYAYMFKYSMGRSSYYMQIEDDVKTLPGYVDSIKQYIKEQTDEWTCLEFSELGFIGKLYHTEDLDKMAMMFLLFYQEQPVDYTYLYFNLVMTQMTKKLRKPTLFQHLGIYSSFPGKIQPLKDRYFDNFTKVFKADNPPAEIITSMSVYLTFLPRLAYQGEGYFWSHGAPTDGDTFTVVFQEPQKLVRVVVVTGSEGHPHDRIEYARLDASLTLLKTDNDLKCTNDISLGFFENGNIDAGFLIEKISFKVMCLRITVTKVHALWVIIKEIAVFVSK
ncbi:alpha-1,3-mannosyl-glycoprotein 4-beta-N-acetylglucosaminyltransferase C-like [Gigantopelta aegis]|uniref:alpha-1,3-mannosyl-glycoprotein 4-beta-N-acetylglucosaminyltransferase C-like n=1 Tax=Gigantopelta aegis TaxID=1735272 RepID=UPI001B88D5DB|nr:alpha-1,3-mannosyl-glycoprotein 4-beta-N-acetylglucosaminyltransferase C-like [Gigantopelta aegis]